jgi:1-deoxy-D-xylulose-5-phosphate synthase
MKLPVTFCIDRAGLVGEDGATHHGALDLSYLRSIPGMIVSAPRNEHWLRNLLYTSQSDNYGPFAIRYPRGSGKEVDWQNDMHAVKIGQGERLVDGSDVVVLSIGTIANEVEKAIERAQKENNISVAHYDMVFLKPIDEDILAEVLAKNAPIITVEDGTIKGGLASAVMEWLNEQGASLNVYPIGIPDDFVPQGTVPELYRYCGMDSESIYQTIVNAKNIKR